MTDIPLDTLESLVELAVQFEPCVGLASDLGLSVVGYISYEEAGKRDLLVVLKKVHDDGPVSLNPYISVGACLYEAFKSSRPMGYGIEVYFSSMLWSTASGSTSS